MKRRALGKGLDSLIPGKRVTPAAPASSAVAALEPPPPPSEHNRRHRRHSPQSPTTAARFQRNGSGGACGVASNAGPLAADPGSPARRRPVRADRRRAAMASGAARRAAPIPAIVRDVPDGSCSSSPSSRTFSGKSRIRSTRRRPIERSSTISALPSRKRLNASGSSDHRRKLASAPGTAAASSGSGPARETERGTRKGGRGDTRRSTGRSGSRRGLSRWGSRVRQAEAARRDGVVRHAGWRRCGRDGPFVERPNVVEAEKALQRGLGTKVRIVERGKRGRIEVHYHSPEELDRVYELLFERRQAGLRKGIARPADRTVGGKAMPTKMSARMVRRQMMSARLSGQLDFIHPFAALRMQPQS